MQELRQLAKTLKQQIAQHQSEIEQVQSNTATAAIRASAGASELGKAHKYKTMARMIAFPVVGGLFGGLIAGPVGVIAGNLMEM